MNAQGFNEGQKYTAADIRYTQKGNTIYATMMDWPSTTEVTMKALSTGSKSTDDTIVKIKEVKLLGYGNIPFTQTPQGLRITLPANPTNPIAPVLALTITHNYGFININSTTKVCLKLLWCCLL